MALKLNEAVAYAKKGGKKIRKVDLAVALWTNSSNKTAHTNFSNLAGGKSKKIDIAFVPILCRELGVSADFLFGLTDEPTLEGEITKALKNSPQNTLAKKMKGMLPDINEVRDIIETL